MGQFAIQFGERFPFGGSGMCRFHLLLSQSKSPFVEGTASLYRHQGRYPEAEVLSVREVEIREKALGANHPAGLT